MVPQVVKICDRGERAEIERAGRVGRDPASAATRTG
jgi:hypothetical protein